MEAQHRSILEAALLLRQKKSFAEAIPAAGSDQDVEREQAKGPDDAFS